MEVFTIAPANARVLWLVGLVPLAVLVIVIAVLWASISGARTARFELSPEGLRLRGDWYGRLIPADQLVRGGKAGRLCAGAGAPAGSQDDGHQFFGVSSRLVPSSQWRPCAPVSHRSTEGGLRSDDRRIRRPAQSVRAREVSVGAERAWALTL